MNFKTLALDSELKKELLEELDNFMNEKEYYQRSGKAWKRGYLLYGPPGTGRIMIFTTKYRERLDPALLRPGRMDMHICLSYSNASVFDQLAFNYLGLDHHRLFHEIKRLIEEIEVTPAEVGGELMKSRDPQVTLSGLLNFVDGLHSCCGESRIIIFTMNYKGLDQALLRAGRVDTHICLSFCNAPIFAQLASTIWGFTVIICLMTLKDDKRDRGESSKSGWRVDEEQDRSSSLFKAL
nr:AAA-ATPase At3g50940-like [Ziziphus jujuba var. spinosa]